MNKVLDVKFAAIVDAVCYWLGYQFKIGRNHLVHEASLRYPVADTITSMGVAIDRIVLERLHPLFKGKRIDLVIYSLNSKKDDADLEEAYEFKLAKIDTSKLGSGEPQRVFDDIARLAYYNQQHKIDCYFLMCGEYQDFKAYFVGERANIEDQGGITTVPVKTIQINVTDMTTFETWIPQGIYMDWFDFKIGEKKEKTFNTTDGEWGLKSFRDRYTISDSAFSYQDSITIKTTCIAITPNGQKNRTHAAGIWKIESAPGVQQDF